MTHLRINRRTLLTGTVALGTVGLLAACGGGSDKKISGKAASSTEEIVKNLEINKQDRSSLKQGGEFRGSVSAVGPNFNILTQSGYTTENLTAFGGACNIPSAIGFTSLSPAGEYSLNDDYVSDYKAETVDGVQTITFKLNSKAVFNDGTPVDLRQSAPRGPSTATPMMATMLSPLPSGSRWRPSTLWMATRPASRL